MDKQKYQSLIRAYKQFMETGFGLQGTGELHKVVDKSVVGFGTTIDEKIKGIPALKKLLRTQIKQSKGIDISWKIKPFSHYTTEDGNSGIFADDLYLSFRAGKETVKMYIRFSVVLNYARGQWKVIHWHGSKPEQVESEKDTFGIESWKQRAAELEKLVEEKTADLLVKNRELEIETALEKVRAIAMGMKSREDMLQICKAISFQLTKLGVEEIRNVQTAIIYESRGTYMNYEYYQKHAKPVITETSYTNNKMHRAFASKMLKGKGEFFVTHIKGKKVKEWLAYQKTTNVFIDNYLATATSLNYYWHSLGPVALGMSTYSPLDREGLDLLRRFCRVFALAYRRYLDIENAAARTREAQIQLALERVRARTMAMQKSDELFDTAALLFQQFKSLGEEMMQMTIGIVNEKERVIEFSVTDWGGGGAGVHRSFNLSIDEPALISKMYQAWKKRKKSVIVDLTGKNLENWIRYRNKMSGVKVNSQDTKGRRVVNIACFSKGLVSYSSPGMPSAESIGILERFASLFDQTYTRFLDLQNAEAQAREAQLEAALERVRTAAMAMHSQAELSTIGKIIYNELKGLGFSKIRNTEMIINNDDRETVTSYHNSDYGQQEVVEISYKENPRVRKWAADLRRSDDAFVPVSIGRSELKKWDQYRKELGYKSDPSMATASKIYYYSYSTGLGAISVSVWEPLGEEQIKILERFRNVFKLSYRRYVDLAKAAAQAREAQIEAALERVRSRSIGMQKSEELKDVIKIVYQQLVHLNIHTEHAGFIMDYKTRDDLHIWLADQHLAPSEVTIPWFDSPPNNSIKEAKEKGQEYCTYYLSFEEKNKFYRDLFKLIPGIQEETQAYYFKCPGLAGACVLLENIVLYIENFSGTPYTNEEHEVLMRFGKVFQQTYTRFLDLQKAEAQSREAQIQLALERVRARTMAMQKSDELQETSYVVFEELRRLGELAEQLSIGVFNEERKVIELSVTLAGNKLPQTFDIEIDEPYLMGKAYNAWKKNKRSFICELSGKNLREYNEYRNRILGGRLSSKEQKFTKRITYFAFFKKGLISFSSHVDRPPETILLLERFAAAFDQTYTRFLDLQKAEAQSKEAQIQLALERVRARTMAMQKSDELPEAATLLFQQMQSLGMPAWSAGYCIWSDDKDAVTLWMSSEGVLQPPFVAPTTEDELFIEMRKGHEKGKPLHIVAMGGKKLQAHYQYMRTLPVVGKVLDSIIEAGHPLPSFQVMHYAYFSKGYLLFITYETVPEAHEIFKRFASVFDQTYTRFLDMKKAEAQAREAQIEASLERVRSRTMAMHKSEELSDTSALLFDELIKLDIKTIRSGFGIYDEAKQVIQLWLTALVGRTSEKNLLGSIPLGAHDSIRENYEAWKENKPMMVHVFSGDEVKNYYQHVGQYLSLAPADSYPDKLVFSVFFFSEGSLNVMSAEPLSDTDCKIMLRFANVFGLTYRRFLDLQKAEAQAREAHIESALEKVRSRTLAMQKSDELAETAAVLFQQLIILGIAPNRLYIIIMEEGRPDLEAWVTDEDGSKVSMGFTGNYTRNGTMKKMYDGWRQKMSSLVIDMHGRELEEYFHYLHDDLKVPFKGGLEQKRRVQHIAYFNHGLIGMASPELQPDETIQLLERFAAVFNLTFTRFNDLKLAEAHALQAEQDLVAIKDAKQKAEQALTELQATQRQLIQSEKMASLGELTAGIAHEIQNPLNFVNNFSEVSKELLDEMRDAIDKGDTEDAKEIMNDVIQNLEKINHHGKRADGIVKGMLQHSRAGSGQKEPADINALCDEYLRLAYHGLRAKDKTFNAKFETSFDDKVGKINVLPQDLGRVILNLINNAFYAVTERKKQGETGYDPMVTISTVKTGDMVEIKVTDNGTGIPKKVLDKIFQPFFTTKPTGQGTGLGLSLSYDIITKGHGGELTVQTNEGEGTTFIIQIPV